MVWWRNGVGEYDTTTHVISYLQVAGAAEFCCFRVVSTAGRGSVHTGHGIHILQCTSAPIRQSCQESGAEQSTCICHAWAGSHASVQALRYVCIHARSTPVCVVAWPEHHVHAFPAQVCVVFCYDCDEVQVRCTLCVGFQSTADCQDLHGKATPD
jgi:hypothetical protein